jgi:hypothetical protein
VPSESKNRLAIILAISAALASATCDGASDPAQTEDGPGHNAGADCQGCHGQFSMAGTVFATSAGHVPQPDVPVSLAGEAKPNKTYTTEELPGWNRRLQSNPLPGSS